MHGPSIVTETILSDNVFGVNLDMLNEEAKGTILTPTKIEKKATSVQRRAILTC